MLIRQSGAQSQPSIIDRSVFMLTIFRITEEIPRITTMSLWNAHFGRKTRILKISKMGDVPMACHATNAMVGKRKSFTQ